MDWPTGGCSGLDGIEQTLIQFWQDQVAAMIANVLLDAIQGDDCYLYSPSWYRAVMMTLLGSMCQKFRKCLPWLCWHVSTKVSSPDSSFPVIPLWTLLKLRERALLYMTSGASENHLRPFMQFSDASVAVRKPGTLTQLPEGLEVWLVTKNDTACHLWHECHRFAITGIGPGYLRHSLSLIVSAYTMHLSKVGVLQIKHCHLIGCDFSPLGQQPFSWDSEMPLRSGFDLRPGIKRYVGPVAWFVTIMIILDWLALVCFQLFI